MQHLRISKTYELSNYLDFFFEQIHCRNFGGYNTQLSVRCLRIIALKVTEIKTNMIKTTKILKINRPQNTCYNDC